MTTTSWRRWCDLWRKIPASTILLILSASLIATTPFSLRPWFWIWAFEAKLKLLWLTSSFDVHKRSGCWIFCYSPRWRFVIEIWWSRRSGYRLLYGVNRVTSLKCSWVSACCSRLWRLWRHCFRPVCLVLTRSVRSVGTAQVGLELPSSHSY